MLDLKRILADPEVATALMRRRDPSASFDGLLALNDERKRMTSDHNGLRHQQKTLSQAFGKKGTAPEAIQALRAELKAMSGQVKDLEVRIKALEGELQDALLDYPNLPADDVPAGKSDADNVLVRSWGEPTEHDFDADEHDVVGERLGLFDFEAASRLSGSGFALYKGLGARLERALASMMLDMHSDSHGYTEVLTPFIVRRDAMIGTGQLPKFEDDAYRIESDDLFLIPTAEVPVTNMWREQVFDAAELPLKHCAFSPCFRREAGSYGREVRGLTRTHQFQKVELVQCVPEDASDAAHEALTGHAEAVLKALELPYRVMLLCGGDLSFAAARCYDLEVWLPGQQIFREISSCSNFRDFQARRADIRYRPSPGDKPRFVHTLNGSGLAIGRTVMALLEVHQQADGSVRIPDALRPYMRVDAIRAG